MSPYKPSRGRPRQPWCPDCLKDNHRVPKEENQGYCRIHQRTRVRKAYIARQRESKPDYVHPSELEAQLEESIRVLIDKHGIDNYTPDVILGYYKENGFFGADIDEIRIKYFPHLIKPLPLYQMPPEKPKNDPDLIPDEFLQMMNLEDQ